MVVLVGDDDGLIYSGAGGTWVHGAYGHGPHDCVILPSPTDLGGNIVRLIIFVHPPFS
jgi:hypothetical protein